MLKIKKLLSKLRDFFKITIIYDAFIIVKNFIVKYKFIIPTIVTAIFVIGFAISPFINKLSSKDAPAEPDITNEYTIFTEKIYVTVAGEVKKPGMYEMTSDDRVDDAIKKAGGFTDNAYTQNINLAQKLSDEQYINVISIEESESMDFSSSSSVQFTGIVNINTATAEELCKLPGIGESTANKIIEYRENYGNFESIEQLKSIKGIGNSKYNNIKNNITV